MDGRKERKKGWKEERNERRKERREKGKKEGRKGERKEGGGGMEAMHTTNGSAGSTLQAPLPISPQQGSQGRQSTPSSQPSLRRHC